MKTAPKFCDFLLFITSPALLLSCRDTRRPAGVLKRAVTSDSVVNRSNQNDLFSLHPLCLHLAHLPLKVPLCFRICGREKGSGDTFYNQLTNAQAYTHTHTPYGSGRRAKSFCLFTSQACLPHSSHPNSRNLPTCFLSRVLRISAGPFRGLDSLNSAVAMLDYGHRRLCSFNRMSTTQ